MNKRLLLITVALLNIYAVNIYAGAQAAAYDLSLLGAKIQPKVAQLQKELDALNPEELQARLNVNVTKARRHSLSPEERSFLHCRNCEISKQILDSCCSLDQDELKELTTELAHNIRQLNIHSIKPSERSDIALDNIVIVDKLTKLGVQLLEE